MAENLITDKIEVVVGNTTYSYDQTTWRDGSSPPINAANLNNIEKGILLSFSLSNNIYAELNKFKEDHTALETRVKSNEDTIGLGSDERTSTLWGEVDLIKDKMGYEHFSGDTTVFGWLDSNNDKLINIETEIGSKEDVSDTLWGSINDINKRIGSDDSTDNTVLTRLTALENSSNDILTTATNALNVANISTTMSDQNYHSINDLKNKIDDIAELISGGSDINLSSFAKQSDVDTLSNRVTSIEERIKWKSF